MSFSYKLNGIDELSRALATYVHNCRRRDLSSARLTAAAIASSYRTRGGERLLLEGSHLTDDNLRFHVEVLFVCDAARVRDSHANEWGGRALNTN